MTETEAHLQLSIYSIGQKYLSAQQMARACYTLLPERGKTNIGDGEGAGCSAESESHAASITRAEKEGSERQVGAERLALSHESLAQL